MENAAKALEIAGGVLIALLIISLFVYMFNQVSYHQSMQNQNLETQKLEAFNKTYEAYNKSILYGADVISVINMAISNNYLETMDGNPYDETDANYINVIFKLNEDITTKIVAVEFGETVEEGEVVQLTDGSLAEETRLNAKDGTGDQIEYTISDEELMKKIELILPSETGTVIKYDKRLGLTLIAQEAYEEFINRIFTCERVTYHPTTGKVNGMVFTELDTNPVTP